MVVRYVNPYTGRKHIRPYTFGRYGHLAAALAARFAIYLRMEGFIMITVEETNDCCAN
jgi:hypothetical protein